MVDDFETAKSLYDDILESSIKRAKEMFPAPDDTPEQHIPSPLPLDAVPLLQQNLAPSDWKIVSRDPIELLQDIRNGLSAVTVIGAFMRACLLGHQLLNCATEFLPERALETATKLDNHLKETGKPYGPLHGLPFSIKELISFEGLTCHAANSFHIERIMDKNSALVDQIYLSGAVPFVRTNGPQILMSGESHSPLHGRTLNPHNTTLSSGGSSSGEGALVGLGASVIGVGTDIGGSVREPASFCGIFSLRPTYGRISEIGSPMMMAGNEAIRSVCGPLTRSLPLLSLFMKTIGDQKAWKTDPTVDRWLWKDIKEELKDVEKLRIGYCWDDRFVKAFPPIERGIKELVKTLTGRKYDGKEVELVEYEPYQIARANHYLMSFYFPDGGERIRNHLSHYGEPITPQTLDILSNAKKLTLEELWQLQVERDEYRLEFHRDFVTRQNLDALIYPVANTVAPVFDSSKNLAYCGIWNLMDYPCTVVPLRTKVEDYDYQDDFRPRNDFEKECWAPWDPRNYHGAPVCVQIVAPRWHDELSVELASWIENEIDN